jgi:hypothetical protein
VGLICLIVKSIKKTMKNKHSTATIDLFLFFILQVVGLASTLLQLVGLTCLLADGMGKAVDWIKDLILGLMDPDQGEYHS